MPLTTMLAWKGRCKLTPYGLDSVQSHALTYLQLHWHKIQPCRCPLAHCFTALSQQCWATWSNYTLRTEPSVSYPKTAQQRLNYVHKVLPASVIFPLAQPRYLETSKLRTYSKGKALNPISSKSNQRFWMVQSHETAALQELAFWLCRYTIVLPNQDLSTQVHLVLHQENR